MAIRIATAPVSWGILEVEGWGKQKPYGEVLDEIVQAGYTGTELGPYGFLPTDPTHLKSELSKRKLPLLGAFVRVTVCSPVSVFAAVNADTGVRFVITWSEAGARPPFAELRLARRAVDAFTTLAGRLADEEKYRSAADWWRYCEAVASSAPNATADLTVPWKAGPASVTPRCSG